MMHLQPLKTHLMLVTFWCLSFNTTFCQNDITWIGGTGNWNVASNWEGNAVPSSEHQVRIPASAGDVVTIPADYTALVGSMDLDEGSILKIGPTGRLRVTNNIDNWSTIENQGDINVQSIYLWGESSTLINSGEIVASYIEIESVAEDALHNLAGGRMVIQPSRRFGIEIFSEPDFFNGFSSTIIRNDQGAEIVIDQDGIAAGAIYIYYGGHGVRIENEGIMKFGSVESYKAVTTARFSAFYEFNNLTSGKIFGYGVIRNLNNSGTIAPGFSPGTFELVGDYDHSDAIYEVELAGTADPGKTNGHDQIKVTGTATLGGVLKVELVDDFYPEADEGFVIMTCETGCQGEFSTVNLPLDPTSWEVAYPGNEVRLTYINQKPEFTSEPLTSIYQNEFYQYLITASDADGDPLSFSSTNIPDWLTLTDNGDGTALLSGTPQDANVGLTEITIATMDSKNALVQQTFQLEVFDVNDPPVFSNTPSGATLDEPYQFVLTIVDPEGDDFNLSHTNLPGWITFTENADGTVTLSGTPRNSDLGTTSITISATDANGAQSDLLVDLEVIASNNPPTFTSTPVSEVAQDALYEYYVTAEDIDGHAMTFNAEGIPSWLMLSDNGDGTATLSGTAGSSEVGTINVALDVTDAYGLSAQQTFDLEVENINDPPVFTSEPVTQVEQSQSYQYIIATSDPDGDEVSITSDFLPSWLTLLDNGNGSAVLSGTPTENDQTRVTLIASDEAGLQSEQTFSIYVVDLQNPVWVGGEGNWNEPSNWDIKEVPEATDYVHIPPSVNNIVHISDNQEIKIRTIEVGLGASLILDGPSSRLTLDDGEFDNQGNIENWGTIKVSQSDVDPDNENYYGPDPDRIVFNPNAFAFFNLGTIENHGRFDMNSEVFRNDLGSEVINHPGATLICRDFFNFGGQVTNHGNFQSEISSDGYGDYGNDEPGEDITYVARVFNYGEMISSHIALGEFADFENFGSIEIDQSISSYTRPVSGITLHLNSNDFQNSGIIRIGSTVSGNGIEIRGYGSLINLPGGQISIEGVEGDGIKFLAQFSDGSLRNDPTAEINIIATGNNGIHIENSNRGLPREHINSGKLVFGIGIPGNAFLSNGANEILINQNGAEIVGTGIIDGSAFKNQGIITPGFSPGVFEIDGDYNHSEAIYEVELAGTDGPGKPQGHDQIIVTGTTTLGGTLNLSLIGDYIPTVGDSFVIMNCTSGCQGEFEKVNLPLDPLSWEIQYEENSVTVNYITKSREPQHYEVLDIDYCIPREAPFYNFYWTEMKSIERGSEFFSQNETHTLAFTEYADGTALIQGTTQSGTCSAELYIVLKDRKNWARWSADGGGFKPHGCDTASLVKEALRYYVIDGSQSTISVTGGDCLEEGAFMVTQRPDPDDPSTDNLGVHIGPGGALFDSDPTAEGLAGWAWMGPEGDERRWKIDFNFHIERSENLAHESEEVCDGIDNNGDGQIDEGLICEEEPSIGVSQTVIIPYPTRFNDRLNMQIEIDYSATAQVQLFDLQWRSVMVKKDLNILPGKNDLSLDVAGLVPNMYILVLNTGREEFKLKVFAK